MCTAVADDFHTAGLAFVAVIGFVASFVRYRHTEEIAELEVHRLAFIAQTRFVRLICLRLAALDLIDFTVLYEASACADKGEGDVVFLTLVTELFYPFIMTETGTRVVLAVADHLFDLSARQILFYAHFADKGRAHNSLVPERQ